MNSLIPIKISRIISIAFLLNGPFGRLRHASPHLGQSGEVSIKRLNRDVIIIQGKALDLKG
jgi:hypothetical protein